MKSNLSSIVLLLAFIISPLSMAKFQAANDSIFNSNAFEEIDAQEITEQDVDIIFKSR